MVNLGPKESSKWLTHTISYKYNVTWQFSYSLYATNGGSNVHYVHLFLSTFQISMSSGQVKIDPNFVKHLTFKFYLLN